MTLKLRGSAIVALAAVAALCGLTINTAAAQELRWQRIIGIQQTGDLVGVGTGQVTGGAPWESAGGSALVNLDTGNVRFNVEGLILAIGSVPGLGLTGLPIGTPAGVTEVKGTLVCDVDGTANGGNSVLVDTPAVPLDAQGDAHFRGTLATPAPSLCSTESSDDAFLIRIVQPAGFADRWIAFGAILTSSTSTSLSWSGTR
jgi:hypothetical protein